MIVKMDAGLFEALKKQGWDEQGAAIIATASPDIQKLWMEGWSESERLAYLDNARLDPFYSLTGDYVSRWIAGPAKIGSADAVSAGIGGAGVLLALVAAGGLIWVLAPRAAK